MATLREAATNLLATDRNSLAKVERVISTLYACRASLGDRVRDGDATAEEAEAYTEACETLKTLDYD